MGHWGFLFSHVREPSLKFQEWTVIAQVGRSCRCKILISNHAARTNRFFRPLTDRTTLPLEPDVREQPRPPAVAVRKRVDPNRSVMKPHGLLEEIVPT
jgi:hypothetical protein